MTAIEFVSVIITFHINGLHLFWDTLYPKVTSEVEVPQIFLFICILCKKKKVLHAEVLT